MDVNELEERIEEIQNLMTPENIAELSEEELESLSELLDGLEALLDK